MAVASGSPDKHNPVAGILWMIGAACCFAASLSLVKALQDDGMTPFQAVLFRQVFGLVIFIPVILRVGVTSLKTPVPHRHCMRAIFGFLGMCTGYYSLVLINVADSVALQFTLPIFTMMFAIWLLKERPTPTLGMLQQWNGILELETLFVEWLDLRFCGIIPKTL